METDQDCFSCSVGMGDDQQGRRCTCLWLVLNRWSSSVAALWAESGDAFRRPSRAERDSLRRLALEWFRTSGEGREAASRHTAAEVAQRGTPTLSRRLADDGSQQIAGMV